MNVGSREPGRLGGIDGCGYEEMDVLGSKGQLAD